MLRGSITIIRHAHACAHTRYRFISLLLTALRLSNNLKTNKKNFVICSLSIELGFGFFYMSDFINTEHAERNKRYEYSSRQCFVKGANASAANRSFSFLCFSLLKT